MLKFSDKVEGLLSTSAGDGTKLLSLSSSIRDNPQYVANSPKLIAFYLPQFHPIPENDEWWGKGFTEWTNVTKAVPYFDGHVQPRRPADLGYYDLRLPEIQEQQAAIAEAYGIYGFCYYYYWFSGRRLLDRPLLQMLEQKKPTFPFCICWANENWTRIWDGSENEILLNQTHSYENSISFLKDAMFIFEDDRYIKIDGKPLLLIYRAALITDIQRITEAWRDLARQYGFPDLHLVAVESFGYKNTVEDGFDASVEFPPHSIVASNITRGINGLHPEFRGAIFNYHEVMANAIGRTLPSHLVHRGVMVSWDNTPRRGLEGNLYHGSSPSVYERWLRFIVEQAQQNRDLREPFIFLNAWNEWGEGAYLEPDEQYGYGYLQATKNALQPVNTVDKLLDALKRNTLGEEEMSAVIEELKEIYGAQSATVDTLLDDIYTRLHAGPLRSQYVSTISSFLSRWPGVHRASRRVYRTFK